MDRFFVKNIKLIPLILVLVVIFISSLGIFLVNKYSSNHIPNISSIGNDLKGYSSLKQKLNSLTSEPSIIQDATWGRMIKKLSILENSNLSQKERYDALVSATQFLEALYSQYNNPKLHFLINDFDIFAKNNFSKYYNKTDFSYFCQDSICADTLQPKEISKIINEIKTSDFPDYIQNSIIKNLLNNGYLSKKDNKIKLFGYLSISQTVKNYSEYTKKGANIKIANEIFTFAQNSFPNEFNELKKIPSATGSGIIN